MIHKITDSYCTWLTEYSKHNPTSHKKTVILLMKKLALMESIESLKGMLSEFPVPRQEPAFFNDPFIKKYNDFVAVVDQLSKVNINALCAKLDRISVDDKTKAIIALIKEILGLSQSLLHNNISNLLAKLEDIDKLQASLLYLAEQPQSVRSPRPGTFEALLPRNDTHKICIDLHRNNTTKYKEANQDSVYANHLMQLLLKIYEDINTRPAPLHRHSKSSCCIQ